MEQETSNRRKDDIRFSVRHVLQKAPFRLQILFSCFLSLQILHILVYSMCISFLTYALKVLLSCTSSSAQRFLVGRPLGQGWPCAHGLKSFTSNKLKNRYEIRD
jgi:hypothetical protein